MKKHKKKILRKNEEKKKNPDDTKRWDCWMKRPKEIGKKMDMRTERDTTNLFATI